MAPILESPPYCREEEGWWSRREEGGVDQEQPQPAVLETPPLLHPLHCAPSLRRVAPRRVAAATPCRVDDVASRMDCCTAARRSGATQELHIWPVTTVPVTYSVFCLKGEKLSPEAPSPFLLPLTDPFLPATRVDALFSLVKLSTPRRTTEGDWSHLVEIATHQS
jgi:hypothetical protein